jgi:hypothetical protein
MLLAVMAEPAMAGCRMLVPGPDGVLRLDGGAAWSAPCHPLRRAYAALPPEQPRGPLRRARPAPREPRTVADPAVPKVANPAPAPMPVADEGLRRLQDQTARLQAELARLTEETTRLRGETARLSDQLARRETPAAPLATAPASQPPAAAVPAPPPAADAEAQRAEAEREVARQRGVVERAWSQLLDLAARMKRDLGAP